MHSPNTATDIKQVNKLKVLKYVKGREATTKPEVSNHLGISRPTVSALVDELIKDNLIINRGMGSSTEQGGKRPQLISFNSLGRVTLSIHVGMKIIEGAILDLKANIVLRISKKTNGRKDKAKVLTLIINTISELLEKCNDLYFPILGIGVSCLGVVDTRRGMIINSVHFSELNNFALGEFLSNKFNLPVLLGNDSQNLALAEKQFGIGENTRTSVSLSTDTGIGAGIIIENRIFRGLDNSFGEIGHTTINIDGPKCSCGNNGCWETYASSDALFKMVFENLEETSILKQTVQTEEMLRVSHIVDAINKGDKKVEQIAIENLGKYLGIGLVNLVNTINPELITIHGEITELGEKLRDEIQKWVTSKALPTPASRAKIVFSSIENANILGAGALVITELFDKPEYIFHISKPNLINQN